MKKNKIILLAILIFVIIFAGCKDNGSKSVDSSGLKFGGIYAAQITPKDSSQAVMWVDYDAYMREYKMNYIQGSIDDITDNIEMIVAVNQLKIQTIEHMIKQKLVMKGAQERGITFEGLTDEEKKQARINAENYILQLADEYGRQSDAESPAERLDEFFEQTGLSVEYIYGMFEEGKVEQKLQELFTEEVEAEEYDLPGYLKHMEEVAKELYEENFEEFASDLRNFSYYIPDGTRAVEIIRINLDQGRIEQIYALRNDNNHSAADKLLENALNEIKETADIIIEKKKNGKTAYQLRDEYSADSNISVIVNNPVLEKMPDKTGVYGMKNPGDIAIRYDDMGYFVVVYKGLYEHSEELKKDINDDIIKFLKSVKLRDISNEFLEDLQNDHSFDINYDLLEISLETDISENNT